MTQIGMDILAIWTPGIWEIAVILLIILILFGGKKLPELARGLGRGMREFRDEVRGTRKELEDTTSFDDDYHVEEASPSQQEDSDEDSGQTDKG
jgi:sec-independent protein translocase protein TatA